MKCLRKQHGFALIVVLGVTALMVVYLVAVQSAVQMTHGQGRLSAQRQDVSENLAALLTLALAAAPGSGTLELKTPTGGRGNAQREPLPPAHDFWRRMPLLKPLAGDELFTLQLRDAPGGALRARYLVNRQGLRPGVVPLDTAEIGGASATAPSPIDHP